MPALTADNLASHLRQLTTAGGADNRLLVASRDYYMVFSGRHGEPELHAEAVSNAHLSTAAALTPGRRGVLTRHGFSERPNRTNFYRTARPQDDAALRAFAEEMLAVFAGAYGVDAGEPAVFDLQLGEPEPTRNPDVVRLMKMVSVMRDWETRKLLYSALLAAKVLVPVDADSPGGEEPLEVEKLGQFPVWAAFTDVDSLRMWQPKGAPFRVMAVADLVPVAVGRRIGSLLINPRGLVGGELYLNELESLDGALKRRASVV